MATAVSIGMRKPHDPSAIAALIDLLEREPEIVVEVTLRVNALPGAPRARDYTDAEIRQMSFGMAALLTEALVGRSSAVRLKMLDVLMPMFVAQGETARTLVQWNTSYLAMLSWVLAQRVAAAHREAAADWMIDFSGGYLADVARSAAEAEGEAAP